MNTQETLDMFIQMLASGRVSPELQVTMARDLAPVSIELRRANYRLDQIANDDALNELERAEAEKIRRALPVAAVLQFPDRQRAVRLATPSVVAVEQETWR